jgi:pimeloyl-ACP methyl ester carboxylesterase
MSGVRLARILIAAVLALLVVVPASAGAATGQQLSWQSCHAEAGPAFQCAVAQVPLNYSAPHGPAISIALTRLPATDPAHRIGSLFLDPGGPGLSGVDYVLEAGARLFTDEVRARFDLVGFDPRGIARSTPLRCFDSPSQWPPSLPFTFPLTREQAAQWAAKDRALESACRQRGGPILNHMSTANAARDLDVLRELVGDNQLSYDGTSYGTYLGVTYANLFPDRVRALVLDGVDDPIAWSTGRGTQGRRVPFTTRLRIDVGTQQTLSQFFRLCDAGGPRCAFSGHAARRYAALVRRLRQHPVDLVLADGSTLTVDSTTLIAATGFMLYDSLSWTDLADLLAHLEALSEGRPQATALRSLATADPRPRYLAARAFAPRADIEESYRNSLEGQPGVACSDSTNPTAYEAWWDNGIRADARSGYFGRYWTWLSSPCAEWPGVDEDRYTGPWNARTAHPVLVVGNRFDPATPYAGAVIVHHLLPHSALLTLKAWGHTSLFLSSCADTTIARYLLDLQTPPRRTVCRQDVVPFTTGQRYR